MSRVAVASVIFLVVGLVVGYFLGSIGNGTNDAGEWPADYSAAPDTTGSSSAVEPDLVTIRRNAIEDEFPELRDFEGQPSFAGQSVDAQVDEGDYYFAYVVHGSGLPIAQARCFRVDRMGTVFEVGVFPDPVDSYAGYRDVNPRNCRGIK